MDGGISQTKHVLHPAVGCARRAWLDANVDTNPNVPSNWRILLFLFLFLNFLYLLTSSGRVRTIDELTVDFQAESLVTRGNFAVPQAVTAGAYYGKRDREGNPQAPYGAGQAVLVAPWYLLGRMLRTVVPGIPAPARDVALDAVVVSSSATFAAIAAGLAFLLLVRLGLPVGASGMAALILALATPLFAYSSWFFSEPLAAALLLATALALFTAPRGAPVSLQRSIVGGLLLGVAIWVRPAHVIAVPVFLLAILVRDRARGIISVCVVACVSGLFAAAYLLRNEFLFGNFFDFGYPEMAEGGKRLNSFNTPLSTGLFGFLLSPGKSLFLFAPPLLLAPAGLFALARRDRGLALVAGLAPLVYLLFYARYAQWEGGYSFGPRYLVPVIPLLILGLGPLLAERGRVVRRLVLVLAVTGFLVQVIGMSTSFLEDQATGAYYDASWNYRMSYSPLVSQTQRLFHYLFSASPAPIGLGFDRWFVFLGKAGVAHGPIIAAILIEFAATLVSGACLLVLLRKSGRLSLG